MSEKEIAAHIFLLSKKKNLDNTILILSILSLIKAKNISKILEFYINFYEKKLTIVQVESARELKSSEKALINKRFLSKKNLIIFSQNSELGSGIKIREGDKILDLTLSGVL